MANPLPEDYKGLVCGYQWTESDGKWYHVCDLSEDHKGRHSCWCESQYLENDPDWHTVGNPANPME